MAMASEFVKSQSEVLSNSPDASDVAEAQKLPETPCDVTEVSCDTASFWTEPELWQAPSYERIPQYDVDQVQAIFLKGLPYHGKSTKMFAFVGFPNDASGKPVCSLDSLDMCMKDCETGENDAVVTNDEANKNDNIVQNDSSSSKVPAMVLVHGGGGTAFAHWVQLWNKRGYAAIAIDTCGSLPSGDDGTPHPRHDEGGPAGWGGFDQLDEAVTDQWTYQAVADVILAHSWIRDLPVVDAQRIGLTGISWGGYLTCITAGVDHRFQFAIPQYGCGFLGDNSVWSEELAQNPNGAKWLKMWDPSVWLPQVQTPLLWISGTNDFAYPLDSYRKSYHLPSSPRTLCLTLRMPHNHSIAPEEIHVFADSFAFAQPPLIKITANGENAKIADNDNHSLFDKNSESNTGEQGATTEIWADLEVPSGVTCVQTELCYTTDQGDWVMREWRTAPATLVNDHVVADLPAQATAWFINVVDQRHCTVSSDLQWTH